MTGSNAENVTNVTPGAIDLSQNPASAYYLHAGENPGLVLVAQLLTGNNYHSWSREFKRALRAKNKLSFVDGSLSMPAEGDVNRPAWDRCNTMICSWISRSVDSSIAKSIHWFENCSDVWSNLEKRFSQGNSIKISDLQEQMYTFTQGSMSVTDYYTQLMTLWEELINYRPLLLCKCLPTCKCSNLLVTAKAYQEEDLVLRFLKGLNPDYSGARSQIFLIKPLPEITSVLSLVLQQERQNQPSCLQLEPSINLVKDQNYEKKKFKCSHCDKPGHTIDQCYRKHGFPANFKFTKAKKGNVTGNVTSGGCNLEDVNFDSGSVVPVSSTVSASSNEGSGVFLSKAQYARLLGMLDAPDQRPKQHTQHNHVIGNVVSDVHSNGNKRKECDTSPFSATNSSPIKLQKTSQTSRVYGSSSDFPILILDSDTGFGSNSISLKNNQSRLYGTTADLPVIILDSDAKDGYEGYCNLNQKDLVVIETVDQFPQTPLTGRDCVKVNESIPIIILDSEDIDANTGYPRQKNSLIETAQEIPKTALTSNDPEEIESSKQANGSACERIVNDTQSVMSIAREVDNVVDDSLIKSDSENDNLSVKTAIDDGVAKWIVNDNQSVVSIAREMDNVVDDSLIKSDSENDNVSVKTAMDDGAANVDVPGSKVCNIQTDLSANVGMFIAGEVDTPQINDVDDGAANAGNDMLMKKDNHQINVEDNILDGIDDDTDDRVCRKFKALSELGLPSSNIQLDEIVYPDIEDNDQANVEDEDEDDLTEIWKEMTIALEYSKDSSAGPAVTAECVEQHGEDCDHSLILKDDLGYVCRVCGVIQKSIDTIFEFQFSKGKRSSRTYERRSTNNTNNTDSSDVTLSLITSRDLTVAEISAHPRHKKHMKPHQVAGFNFLCSNLITDNPGGCILAHAPGSGKTFMIISFIHSFLARYPDARPLVVLPKGILQTWKNEFLKWQVEEIPLHDFYSSKAENRSQQLSILRKWVMKKSILFLGYKQLSAIVCDSNRSQVADECKDILLKVPTILILDEGHTPRNEETDVLRSLSRVQTPRKVVLSGTLYQNHVKEVFNIVNLVRPQFLKLNTSKMIVNRIMSRVKIARQVKKNSKSGLHSGFFELIEYTLQKDEDLKRRKAVIEDLREMTSSILHYYKGDFLDELPGVVDFTVVLNLSPKQKDELQMLSKLDVFKRTSLGSAIYIHPVLKSFSLVSSATIDGGKIDEILEGLDVKQGVKAKFFLNILGLCESAGEKLLVFSQYIMPLKLLERLSEKVKGWKVGREVFMITGDSNPEEREWCMEQFNSSAKARVFFGSIKACGEGISLVGASRILILDVHLNPSVTRQAIGRAFRPGQRKKVFSYRLIAADSPEEKDNLTCSRKEMISKMWFEWNQYSRHQDFEIVSVDPEECEDVFFQSPGLREDVNVLYRR